MNALTKADVQQIISAEMAKYAATTKEELGKLATKEELSKVATSDDLRRISLRLDELERGYRIMDSAPRAPELRRRTHRAVRANSVSGPRYR